MAYTSWPKKKLKVPITKIPVRNSKKHVNLFREVIEIFSLQRDSVLDPYARNINKSTRCIRKSRKCNVIERDSECY